MTQAPIDLESLLACGVVFRSTADPEAGWKLLEGLESPDPVVRMLAQAFLIEGGSASMSILEDALSEGAVSTDTAAPCIAAILRAQIQPKWIASEHVLNRHIRQPSQGNLHASSMQTRQAVADQGGIMDAASILVLVLTGGGVALLIWFEVNSRRNDARDKTSARMQVTSDSLQKEKSVSNSGKQKSA